MRQFKTPRKRWINELERTNPDEARAALLRAFQECKHHGRATANRLGITPPGLIDLSNRLGVDLKAIRQESLTPDWLVRTRKELST